MTIDNTLCKGAAIGFDVSATLESHTSWNYAAFSNSAGAGDYGTISWTTWGPSSTPTITNGMRLRIERYLNSGDSQLHMRLMYKETSGEWISHVDQVDATSGARVYIKARATTSGTVSGARVDKIFKSW